jgi:hypothetical protein
VSTRLLFIHFARVMIQLALEPAIIARADPHPVFGNVSGQGLAIGQRTGSDEWN